MSGVAPLRRRVKSSISWRKIGLVLAGVVTLSGGLGCQSDVSRANQNGTTATSDIPGFKELGSVEELDGAIQSAIFDDEKEAVAAQAKQECMRRRGFEYVAHPMVVRSFDDSETPRVDSVEYDLTHSPLDDDPNLAIYSQLLEDDPAAAAKWHYALYGEVQPAFSESGEKIDMSDPSVGCDAIGGATAYGADSEREISELVTFANEMSDRIASDDRIVVAEESLEACLRHGGIEERSKDLDTKLQEILLRHPRPSETELAAAFDQLRDEERELADATAACLDESNYDAILEEVRTQVFAALQTE